MGLETICDEELTAQHIYDWMQENISYDYEKARNGPYDVRTPYETLRDRKGICSDQALLYIDMLAREGINARYVGVDIDVKGEQVQHGCAEVYLPNKTILVDTCYPCGFDIKHQKTVYREPNAAAAHSGDTPVSLAVGAVFLGVAVYLAGLFGGVYEKWPFVQPARTEHCASTCTKEIRTKNGSVQFKMPHKAHALMEECVLIKELTEGELGTYEEYALYKSADTHEPFNFIDVHEARYKRDSLR